MKKSLARRNINIQAAGKVQLDIKSRIGAGSTSVTTLADLEAFVQKAKRMGARANSLLTYHTTGNCGLKSLIFEVPVRFLSPDEVVQEESENHIDDDAIIDGECY